MLRTRLFCIRHKKLQLYMRLRRSSNFAVTNRQGFLSLIGSEA